MNSSDREDGRITNSATTTKISVSTAKSDVVAASAKDAATAKSARSKRITVKRSRDKASVPTSAPTSDTTDIPADPVVINCENHETGVSDDNDDGESIWDQVEDLLKAVKRLRANRSEDVATARKQLAEAEKKSAEAEKKSAMMEKELEDAKLQSSQMSKVLRQVGLLSEQQLSLITFM